MKDFGLLNVPHHSEKLRYFLPEIFTGRRDIRMRDNVDNCRWKKKATKDIFKIQKYKRESIFKTLSLSL